MPLITEQSATISGELPPGDVHAQMKVFYNPVMRSHRNISIVLLNALENQNMNIALPLAASGIRALRFLKELAPGKINHIFVNDHQEKFAKTFWENYQKNNFTPSTKKKVTVSNDDASLFLLNQIKVKPHPQNFCGYFDYIDLDPFGSPNPFLAAAIARVTRKGILAITATDTAALSGTYPGVTPRKYWATSLRNYLMHEIGIRILIRKVQLLGMQFDKALFPVLSYQKDHYYRIYFRSERGKKHCADILQEHNYFLFNSPTLAFTISKNNCKDGYDHYAGPVWTGKLFERSLLQKMKRDNPFEEEKKFLEILYHESKQDRPGFYDLHQVSKKYSVSCAKITEATSALSAVRTHFSVNGIKTELGVKELVQILRKSQKKR